jgi:hypothetical protein
MTNSHPVRFFYGSADIDCADSAECDITFAGGGVGKTTRIVTGDSADMIQMDDVIFGGQKENGSFTGGQVTLQTGATTPS